MARRHGKNGKVMMDPTGGAVAVEVASLNAWTLDASSANVEVTSFGDANVQFVKGLPSYQGTVGGWWDATDTAFFDAAFAQTAVTLELIPSTLDATAKFSGLAYVDSSINCPADGAVSITGNWVAAGNWTYTPGV
jgi:hypothetical protein